MIQINNPDPSRICQGDIFEEVPFFETFSIKERIITFQIIDFPYVLVMTQDCDLLSDYRLIEKKDNVLDQKILSTLVVPLYNAEHLWKGEHVSDLNYNANIIGSKDKDKIKKNLIPRYHFIQFPPKAKLANMVIDFKHYFSITSSFLKDNLDKRVCSIAGLFREDISHRFSFYLSRIGLPEISDDKKVKDIVEGS
jgi:hypothetical protein